MSRSSQRNPREVAVLIAEMMHRSQCMHGRLIETDLGALSGRKTIGPAFRRELQRQAIELGFMLYRLEGVAPTLSTAIISLEWVGTVPILSVDALLKNG